MSEFSRKSLLGSTFVGVPVRPPLSVTSVAGKKGGVKVAAVEDGILIDAVVEGGKFVVKSIAVPCAPMPKAPERK